MLIPVFYSAIQRTSIAGTINEANTAVSAISKAADEVYFLGPGNKNTIDVLFPDSIDEFVISNREITIKLGLFNGVTEVVSLSQANLTGNLSKFKGVHVISVEHLDSNTINITEKT